MSLPPPKPPKPTKPGTASATENIPTEPPAKPSIRPRPQSVRPGLMSAVDPPNLPPKQPPKPPPKVNPPTTPCVVVQPPQANKPSLPAKRPSIELDVPATQKPPQERFTPMPPKMVARTPPVTAKSGGVSRLPANSALEAQLSKRLSRPYAGSGSNLPLIHSANLGPPDAPPPTPPSPTTDKKKSKLARPTSKKSKNKASRMYGTLPRLIGGKDKEKEGGNASGNAAGSNGNVPDASPAVPASEIAVTSDPGMLRSGSGGAIPNTPAPAPPEADVKWKRGAEAEAILKLLSETQKEMEKEKQQKTASSANGQSQNGAAPTSAPPLDVIIDPSAIMKILGLEEPGIKLPEKLSDGEPKALDPVSELQLTERNFIADLGLLNETFIKPVRANHVIPSNVLELMELNLDRLISLHRELYKNFLQDSSLLGIANTFNDELISELERLYSVYMGHYEQAIQVFYEKRDAVTQFRKYLKQREEMTDKSIPNLLVTPVQRVCKYELMLASINRTVMKTADPKDLKLQEHSKLLNSRIESLNVALQNIDRKRAAADCWDKITALEANLLLSEPLAKPGRIIILQTDQLVRVNDQEHMFQLVLFNDLLIRTKIPKKSKKGRLLDSIPLSQIQILDCPNNSMHVTSISGNSAPSNERYSFHVINSDPRCDIWTVYFNTEDEKRNWMSNLTERVQSFDQFCEEWKIPKSYGPGKAEALLAADSARWPQEYVGECRLYVTSNYLCILWKMFGAVEREKLPLCSITNCQIVETGKDRGIKCAVSNWKQDYSFSCLQHIELIEPALCNAIQQCKSRPVSSATKVTNATDSFLLSNSEWEILWASATTFTYQPNSSIMQRSRPTNTLYKLVKGTVKVKTEPVQILSEKGTLFGVAGFLDGSRGSFDIQAGDCEVTLLELNREFVIRQFADGSQLLKFFATLAAQLSIA